MKRALALCAALILIAAVITASPASADDDRLTVTVNGGGACTYRVGEEIAFYLDLDVGETEILNGDIHIDYDADKLELVEYAPDGWMEDYSFPEEINLANNTLNIEKPGVILFNFSRAKGIGTLTGDHTLLARFRFRAKAAGTAEITYLIVTMCDKKQNYIYYKGAATADYHPVENARTMIASYLIGDADGNGVVDNRDALILDRYVAGWKDYADKIVYPEAADLNADGVIGLRDAILLDRYIAGWQGYDENISEVDR